MSFLSQFALVFIQVLLFYFISGFLNNTEDSFTDNYFTYVLVGICFIDVLNTIVNYIPREIVNYKNTGIFEELITIKENIYSIFIGICAYPALISIIKIILYFSFAGYLTESSLIHMQHLFDFFLIVFLLIIAFCSVGLLSASYAMVFYKVGVIPIIFLGFSIFLGDAYFPKEIIGTNFNYLSLLTPFDNAVQNIRMIIGNDFNSFLYKQNMIMLICLNVVYLALAIIFLKISIKHAKKNGSFLYY